MLWEDGQIVPTALSETVSPLLVVVLLMCKSAK